MDLASSAEKSERRGRLVVVALLACGALAVAGANGGLRQAADRATILTQDATETTPTSAPTKSCRGDCNAQREKERREKHEEKMLNGTTATPTYEPTLSPAPTVASTFAPQAGRAPVPTIPLPTNYPTATPADPTPAPSVRKEYQIRKSSSLGLSDDDDDDSDDHPDTAQRGAAEDDDDSSNHH